MSKRRICSNRGRCASAVQCVALEMLEARTLLSTVMWTGAGNGTTWEDPNNWSTHALPGATADVVIDVPGNPAITLSSAAASIRSLTLADALTVTGGSLAVATSAAVTGSLTVNGGTISGGAWDATGGVFQAGASTASTVSGISLAGDLVLPGGANLRVSGGITLAPTARIRLNGAATNNLGFMGSTTLASGTISLENTAGLAFIGCVGTGTLTLGAGAAITGGRAVLGQNVFSAGNAGFVNQGVITANAAGAITVNASGSATFTNSGTLDATGTGSLTVSAASWTSSGTAHVGGGGTLTLGGAWSNTGSILCEGGALNLGGTISPSSLAGLVRTGGDVNITGTLNNANSTLTLSDATGSWTLNGGTISGGTVALSGSGTLLFTANTASTLSGVTLNGDLVLGSGNALRIINGLTLAAASRIRFTGDGATLGFSGAQSVHGGEFVFELASGSAALGLAAAGAVTLDSTVHIHGASGTIGATVFGGAAGTLINQGTISADVAGAMLTIQAGGTFTNSGTVEAVSGGTLTISGAVSNFASATLTGGMWRALDGSTLTFSPGAITINAATIELGGNSTFAAVGALATNRGTLILSDGHDFTFSPATGTFTNATAGTLKKMGTGTATIPSALHLDNSGAVVAAGGTLSIAGLILQHSGATLTGGTWEALDGGTLQLPGLVTANGATIVLAGTGSFPALSMLGTNTGSITLADGHEFVFTPTGGVFLNAAGASLIKSGTGTTEIAASLVLSNLGTVRVSGGTLTIDAQVSQIAGATLTGGTWVIDGGVLGIPGPIHQNDATIRFGGATASFPAIANLALNTGTLTLAAGGALTLTELTNTGTIVLNTGGALTTTGALNQNGTATVSGGTLRAGTGGVWTGAFALSASGGVILDGDQTLTNTAAFTGSSGTVTVRSGVVMSQAPFSMGATLLVSGGTLVQARALGLTGPLSIAGGALVLNAASTVATVQVSSGFLEGAADLTVSGVLQWTGGTMSGDARTIVAAAATLTISGGDRKVLARALENAGTANWTSGDLSIGRGMLTNRSGATMNVSSPGRINSLDVSARVINNGTLNKTGSLLATILVPLNNAGTLRVQGGVLFLGAGGVHSGSFVLSSGMLRLGGDHIGSTTASFSGAGTLEQLNGSLEVSGSYAVTGPSNIGGTALFKGSFQAGVVAIKSGSLELATSANATATSLINRGTLNLNSKTLALTGAFQQGPGATLRSEVDSLGANARFGRLTAGAFTLGGTLQVAWGHVYPDDGTVFTFVSGSSRTGTFGSTVAASLGANRAFRFDYTPTTARMTVRARNYDG